MIRRVRPFRLLSVALVLLLTGTLGACDQAPTGGVESSGPESTEAHVSGATGPAAVQAPDRHIIGVTSKKALQAARNRAESVYRVIELGDRPTAVAGVFPEKAREALRKRAGVAYVEPDKVYQIIGQTLPWGIDRVDADKAHASGETGGDNTDGEGGADIAIIDTGIDSDHPDLKANLGTGKAFTDCKGNPNTLCKKPWDDDNDHGTHVAGIADAADNSTGVKGVSTEATLHAAKVCDNSGSCSVSDIAAALKWTADQGYDVANLSLGGSYSSTIDDAGKYAYNHGVLLVAAAGNDGPCTDCVSYPAANEEFVAVSATTKNDNLAGFSSTGCQVELAAPGKDIYSSVIGGYDTFSGTSMSSPHVAGAAAQLMDNGYANATQSSSDAESANCYPTSPGGARGQLQDSAEEIGLASSEQGEGLLDVEAALGLAGLSVDDLSATEEETSDDDAEFDVSWSVSDPEGNLSEVTLVLYDSTAAAQDASTTISVSGGSASDTTGLVATGDEGRGHSYGVKATVTDGGNSTASKAVSTSETEDTPTVDALSLGEVETSDPDAEFDASWDVSDTDGDLGSLDLVLRDETDGEKKDSKTVSVNGDADSGTTRLVASGDDGSGHTYEVEAIVSDTDGTTSSKTATATESESTSSAPTVETHKISEAGSPNPHLEISVDWGVTDSDGDLKTVKIIAADADGSAFKETHTYSVSGSNASGSDSFTFKQVDGETADVTIYVKDSAGNTNSHTEQVTE